MYTKSIALAVSLVASTAIGGIPRYSLTALPRLSNTSGVFTTVNAINDNGVAVGGELAMSGDMIDWTKARPLTWSNGQPVASALPTLSGLGGIANAINNNGLVVGNSSNDLVNGYTTATLFRTTGATVIPTPFGANSYTRSADEVNNNGVVAVTDNRGLPYLHNSVAGTNVTPQRGGGAFFVGGFNDAGVLYANESFSSSSRAVRLTVASAPTPLYPNSYKANVYDLNNANVGVGFYYGNYGEDESTRKPAIFANGDVSTFTLNNLPNGTATAINDRSDIVGTAGTGAYSAANGTTFLRRGTQTVSLTFYVNGTLPVGFVPVDINDRGQIVGNAVIDTDGNASTPPVNVAYRLDPVRKPGDANDDTAVNFADLVILAQNYNHSGNVFWENGDFDYDRTVGFNDLVTLAQNYNSPASFEADFATALSLVPEPTTVGSALAVAVVVGSRTRGKQRSKFSR